MFNTKEKPEVRTYLEILNGLKPFLTQGLKRIATSHNKQIFIDLSNFKYSVNSLFMSGDKASALLTKLKEYAILQPLVHELDRAIGQAVQDRGEMEKLLEGLSLSTAVLGGNDKQNKCIELYRQHPVLIYCRCIELMEMV